MNLPVAESVLTSSSNAAATHMALEAVMLTATHTHIQPPGTPPHY